MIENNLNIRQFKLLNGEEIIALVTQKDADAYIVERPFLIRSNIIGGFLFMPWFPFSSQKVFKLANGNIMHHVEIDEEMKTEYIRFAAELAMRPRMQMMKNDQVDLDDLTDWIADNYDENENNEIEEMDEKYGSNVIPFPKPKGTIH